MFIISFILTDRHKVTLQQNFRKEYFFWGSENKTVFPLCNPAWTQNAKVNCVNWQHLCTYRNIAYFEKTSLWEEGILPLSFGESSGFENPTKPNKYLTSINTRSPLCSTAVSCDPYHTYIYIQTHAHEYVCMCGALNLTVPLHFVYNWIPNSWWFFSRSSHQIFGLALQQ